MAFLTPALLAGAALVALPVVLHLVMRQEPQRLVFPAMRFLERRRATNQTRLRLLHWLLLALRCAAIALLAAALARPVLRSNAGDGAAGQGLAAAIVLDNAPRLGYVQDNRSRLDAAKETAAWLLGQFAADSRVAVIDRGDGSRRLADRDAALLRAERVMLRADTRPLADAVADALAVVGEQTDARQEVYVFTDLADAEWSESARERVSDALDRHSGARLYVVDVGVPRAINRGLRAVELSTTSPLAGQEVTVRTGFYATASAPTQPTTIELWLSDGDAPPQKRGETIVQAAESGDGTDAAVEFSLAALDEGVHQGFVRVLGSDPLAADDLRHFTLSVEPAKPLLVAAASESAALFVREAISPSAAGAAARQPLTFLRFDQLPSAELADIAGVMLLDPPGLPSDVWRRLAGYARRGGSVAVFLGGGASRQTHNAAPPQSLLPGPLKRRSRAETYFRPDEYRHGSLRQLAEFAELIPWPRFPVFESWEFESLASDAVVVARFADDRPALVERRVGQGRVLTLATPVSDSVQGRRGDGSWNLLPTGDDPWPFVLLMGNLADYLAGAGEERRNFAAGEPATLRIPAGAAEGGYVLRTPSGDATRQPAPIVTSEIVVGATEQVGNYRLLAGGAAGRLDTGFSVNAATDAGRLDRIEFSALAADLGEDRVQLATTRDELSRGIAAERLGREFYPLLICLVAAALAAEQWIANRFYASK